MFAPDPENGFVRGSENFVAAAAVKPVHGVASASSIKRDLRCLADTLRPLLTAERGQGIGRLIWRQRVDDSYGAFTKSLRQLS
jgi:hypothetical protein